MARRLVSGQTFCRGIFPKELWQFSLGKTNMSPGDSCRGLARSWRCFVVSTAIRFKFSPGPTGAATKEPRRHVCLRHGLPTKPLSVTNCIGMHHSPALQEPSPQVRMLTKLSNPHGSWSVRFAYDSGFEIQSTKVHRGFKDAARKLKGTTREVGPDQVSVMPQSPISVWCNEALVAGLALGSMSQDIRLPGGCSIVTSNRRRVSYQLEKQIISAFFIRWRKR